MLSESVLIVNSAREDCFFCPFCIFLLVSSFFMNSTLVRFWLKTSTYNAAVGIYATFPFMMAPALLIINAPYGRYTSTFLVSMIIT